MPLKDKLTLAAFIAKFSSEKSCHEYLAKKTLAKRLCIKIAPGATSRALSGSVRIQDFMWRTQPGAGCLGDISLPLTGRAIHSLGFHPHRQAGGVHPTVVYPVMGHHGPGGSKTFPGVAVGEDEILGARGDSHPDAVAFPEAIGQLGGADLQADDLAFLQKL